MNKLRVAVLGAGILGSRHARVFHEQADTEVVAVIDPNPERARSVAERVGAPAFERLGQVWDATELDALAIATPDHLHREAAVAALERGKHVLLEKPLATSLEDAEAITLAAKRSPAVAMVNFSQRYVTEYRWIRDVVRDGRLGEVRMVTTHKFDRIYVPTRMIGWAAATSPIYFMSSHDLDLVHWYLGADPVEAMAQETRGVLQGRGIDVHDGLNALLRFDNGALANIHTSWILPDSYPNMADGFLQIIGSAGMLMLDNGRRRINAYFARGSVEQSFAGPHTADEIDGRIVGAFTDSIGEFLACIREGREPETSPRHAMPIARVQVAVIQSLREHGPIEIKC